MKNRTLIIIFLTALLLCGVLLRAADNKAILKNNERKNELKKEALKKDMELMPGILLL